MTERGLCTVNFFNIVLTHACAKNTMSIVIVVENIMSVHAPTYNIILECAPLMCKKML